MTKIYATKIRWDTDGLKHDLPSRVLIPEIFVNRECKQRGCKSFLECESNIESVNNYLSDTYGWCIEDYQLIER